MGLTLEQIHELQGHFDALGKLNKVYNAIQCYSKKKLLVIHLFVC